MLNDKPQQFIRASDNANDYSEKQAKSLEQAALEDLDDLYNKEANRDVELWTTLGVEPSLIVDDYEKDDERDLNWALGLAGITAAALVQFGTENQRELIAKPVAYREQALAGLVLTRAELVTAGKRLVKTVSDAHYFKLQAKFLNDLAFLGEYTNAQLYSALTELGAMQTVDQLIAQNMDYIARMTPYPKGSPQFKTALNDLIARDSSKGVRQMNRRAVQRIYTTREIGGDISTFMVWIAEGAHPCGACTPRAGEVDTMENWILRGLPGAEVCDGGGW